MPFSKFQLLFCLNWFKFFARILGALSFGLYQCKIFLGVQLAPENFGQFVSLCIIIENMVILYEHSLYLALLFYQSAYVSFLNFSHNYC